VNPRLVAISGPLKESVFALPTEELSLGRDATNSLPLTDPSVSRRHCIIRREGVQFKVLDLDSRNGTLVNSQSVKESWLHHHDEITVGDSVFLFLTEEESDKLAAPSRPVEFDDEKPTRATAEIRPQDVLYLQPDKILSELPATSRLARNLNALLKISRAVHSIRDLDELQAQILDLTFEVAPAEHGAILLDGTNGREFNSVFGRNRDAGNDHPVRVSRTIAQRVLAEGVAILGSDVPGSSGLGKVESLVASQVRSLLCVPLTLFNRSIGCIYLDTVNIADRFNEDHMELVTAIAGISAVALNNARRVQWLEQENQRLMNEITLDRNLVGESPRMKDVFQFLARVAPTEATILIGGESGTGKELAARAAHRKSPRANKPFVAINCAAIPDTLLESELFGYEKGAFTGAAKQTLGKIETAHGGTLFLDEIGDLPVALQVKLLRFLQERVIERVGGRQEIPVDVRIVCATHQSLKDQIVAGRFREDLYYRLAEIVVAIPPLRGRQGDAALLAHAFVRKYATEQRRGAMMILPEAIAAVEAHPWPGNVRELENVIKRAVIMADGLTIKAADVGLAAGDNENGALNLRQIREEAERGAVLRVLGRVNGNLSKAAELLGVSRPTLYDLMHRFGLK
jgi:two-component system, NtrC family, response regulator